MVIVEIAVRKWKILISLLKISLNRSDYAASACLHLPLHVFIHLTVCLKHFHSMI